jgi:hypothetical protein
MHKSPFASMPQGRADFARGEVLAVNMTQNGQVPLFTFRVRFEGVSTSSLDGTGIHDNVLMLQPGFQRPGRQDPPAGGLVHLPEKGSIVGCLWDGRAWVIIGFYTGPTATPETSADNEGRRSGYNPGIEAALARGASSPVTLGDWTFGMQPGDSVMSKGTAKVKVNDYGATIGGCSYAGTWFKADGEVLDRFLKRTVRGPGYWRRHDTHLGPAEALAVLVSAHSEGVHPPGAYQTMSEVFEASPWADAMAPYLLSQRGHVSHSALADGRAAVVTVLTDFAVLSDRLAGTYALKHDAVVQPLTPTIAPIPADELDTQAAVMYDSIVDADGSFRIWSGNKGHLPGAPTKAKFELIPEFTLSYDSKTSTFKLTVGPTAATPLVAIEANGLTGMAKVAAATSVALHCAPVPGGPGMSGIECTPAGVRIFGAALQLDVAGMSMGTPGIPLSMNGAVMTGAAMLEAAIVKSGLTTLGTHVHGGVLNGGGTTAPGLG